MKDVEMLIGSNNIEDMRLGIVILLKEYTEEELYDIFYMISDGRNFPDVDCNLVSCESIQLKCEEEEFISPSGTIQILMFHDGDVYTRRLSKE